MESQVVTRRVNVLAGHLASPGDFSATPAHIFPMRCSNSLSSVIRRYDNSAYFARQGSGSQGCFMKQASTTEQVNYIQCGTHSKLTSCGEMQPNPLDEPTFARPAQIKPGIPTVKGIQSAVKGCKYTDNPLEAPMFAKPRAQCEQPQFQYKESTELEWSPKIDVVESGFNYVVTFPGISINNIKVEVNNQSLIVTGSHSNWSCLTESSNMPDSYYHGREILQGPYRVVWQLPSNANKESVSAEIQDGLLRVTHPQVFGGHMVDEGPQVS